MDFTLPELGEESTKRSWWRGRSRSATSWKRGQNLMEVLTDKASMEVPAPFAGTITALKAEPGTAESKSVTWSSVTLLSAQGNPSVDRNGPDVSVRPRSEAIPQQPSRITNSSVTSEPPPQSARWPGNGALTWPSSRQRPRGTHPHRRFDGEIDGTTQLAAPLVKSTPERPITASRHTHQIAGRCARKVADHMVLPRRPSALQLHGRMRCHRSGPDARGLKERFSHHGIK